MGATFSREKPRHWLLSIAYRLHRFLPMRADKKLDLYLDLEWIAARLAHETSFSVYDPTDHPVRRLDFMLSGIRAGDRVLDLGCADGSISSMIASKGAEVVGIDHNPALVDSASRRYPDIQFIAADARDYLKTAKPFDVLILSHILEHLDEPAAFLREFAPQFQRIYIEVPDFDATHLNKMRLDRGRALVYQDNDHIAEFDRCELKALIAEAGLVVAAEEYAFATMRFWCERQ